MCGTKVASILKNFQVSIAAATMPVILTYTVMRLDVK